MVLAAVPFAACKPADWALHYSSQVARPVWINTSPVSGESPIPRFQFPVSASRRQDGPNNLQGEVPVQVMPGDKVSLVVNGRNPLDPQKFVDVSSLLMELQKVPPASDGAYHVFLAPPNHPVVSGGQKFDVTYVGAPPRDPAKDVRNNPHPPLFVAPLDYSVPKGYGRIQVPTKNVKFALPLQQLQQPQPQPAQFRPVDPPQRPVQAFQQPQQSFRQPQAFQQPQFVQQQQVQFQAPQPVPPVQFQQPRPAQPAPAFQPVQQVQFQPPQPAPVQFQQPRPVQPAPAFQPVQQVKQPAPVPALPVPMAFRPAHQQHIVQLEESRFEPAPVQALEEIPAPDLKPKEPVVLAAESPDFLNVPAETPAPVDVTTEVPVATTEANIASSPQVELKVQETAAPVEEVPAAVIAPAVVPLADPEPTQAPFVPPPPVSTTQATTTEAPTRPAKKRPVSPVQTIDGTPQWPDFQTVRQRQQQNRQQINRQKPAGNAFVPPSPASFSREPTVDPAELGEFSFGQKLRPKIKTNALVSPPAPVPVVPVASVEVAEPTLDADPPVIDRDEPFQTLESQNAASNRGRIRFSRPQDANSLPISTEAPVVRQTESVRLPGRNRFRITTTTTASAPTVTEAQTEATTATATRGDAQPEAEEEVEEEVKATGAPAAEEADEEEEQEKVEPVKEEPKAWNPRLSLAAQRQRESAETAAPATEKPNRGRGTITFANSRLTTRPEQVARPDQPARTVVIRPQAPRVRPATPGSRIQRPVIPQPVARDEEDLPVAPVAPGFGVRDGVVINSAPQQSLLPSGLPVGRRVPESRPIPAQNIRIGPPRIQPTTEKVVIVEEVPEEEFEPEIEDEELIDDEEPEREQEEILDEEVEDNIDDVVSNLAESSQVASASEAAEADDAADALADVPADAQEAGEGEEDEPEKDAVVEDEDKEVAAEVSSVPVTEAVTATTAAAATTTVAATTQLPTTTTETVTEVPEVAHVTEETTLVKPIEETPVELSVANNVDGDAAAAPLAETADERQVLGVSTATEVSLMYELCYRGRCVRVHE